jgi:hypothetical protein
MGAQIVGLPFNFEHEIQRSTLQKFADLLDTKCSVTGLATLLVMGLGPSFLLLGFPIVRFALGVWSFVWTSVLSFFFSHSQVFFPLFIYLLGFSIEYLYFGL